MLNKFPVNTDSNTRANFASLFSHISRYYLGSLTGQEINRLTATELPHGAMVYDTTSHTLKILTDQNGAKTWKTVRFS
ncbi:MAG: hypothetical protein RBU23_12645 [Candidatus Auribacterota bacterium]|jgi:hypothetical protein|nr:hypothetical protein [Candidatus Auribacterota bacterium]